MIDDKLKTYCINLQRREDRLLDMFEQFRRLDKTIDYHFVRAVDGNSINKFPHALGTANKYACLLSHIKAIEKAKEDNAPMALICEDDIIFCEDFNKRIRLFLKQVPDDWDILYLGYFPADFSPRKTMITRDVYKMNGNIGAFAYILRQNIYDIIINELKRESNFVDNALAEIQKRHNAYCYIPFFVYVKSDFSDLSNQLVDYQQIKRFYAEKTEDFDSVSD